MNYRLTYQSRLISWVLKVGALCAALLFLFGSNLMAEGSKDFIGTPGYRLFFWAERQQQIKVYAGAGEFINVGSSHVGVSGGFIRVFRPDGTLHSTYDNLSNNPGLGIINNNVEEMEGPTGGGTTGGAGYEPGIVDVGAGEGGIWTVTFEYPVYRGTAFINFLNDQPWSRIPDQPGNQRVVLSWDVTVTQGGAGNAGGTPREGRVYSNDYHSIMNRNGVTSSPMYYVLSRAGFLYEVQFDEVDPWGFPLYSNNIGLVDGFGNPLYRSTGQDEYIRSDDPSSWTPDNIYLYEPQAEDANGIINNKIFFNEPDENMPDMALTTDVWRMNTHTTWLFNEPEDAVVEFNDFRVEADNGAGVVCTPNSIQTGQGGFFVYELDEVGDIALFLDLNNNGSFFDPVDIQITQRSLPGVDSIFWDGNDGLGNALPVGVPTTIPYRLSLRSGEIHIMLEDVENDNGGLTITLLNDVGVANPDQFFYNHTDIGGPFSGGGTDFALPTNEGFAYAGNFGDELFLDYWAFVPFEGELDDVIEITVVEDCTPPQQPDWDQDGIADIEDIDDDNDGVPDLAEFCNPLASFFCLPGSWDPSGDEDNDAIPNYMDADDAIVNLGCTDADADGICDVISPIYDIDTDGVPDHLDLDSDNDGITDLVEAGHNQPDSDQNGVIDGDPSIFGLNGLYNPIASDPDDFNATETYTRFDWDNDGVPDHDDLDSDNDGINDVAEAGYMFSDTNGDGRIDDGAGNVPMVSVDGLVPLIDPLVTGVGIPLPPDWDGDTVPDWHDLDSDNDGINDVRETNLPDGDNDGFIGTDQPTVNDNGLAVAIFVNGIPVTTTSRPIDTDLDNTPDWHDLDSDNDGIFDTHEANQPDEDDDGLIGTEIPMVNNFGQAVEDPTSQTPLNSISDPEDHDGDGIADFQDIDRDNDGIVDSYECEQWPCVDTDNDGISDVDDLDSDSDGIIDQDECINGSPCPDDNGNGIDNFREFDCTVENTPEIVNISSDTEICEGQTVNLSAGNGIITADSVTFSWTGPNGFMVSGVAPSAGPFPLNATTLTGNDSGLFTLTLESDRGCTSEPEDVFILVNETPLQPLLEVNDNSFCEGEELILTTQAFNGTNVSYQWLFNDGISTIPIATTTVPVLSLPFLRGVQSGTYQVAIDNDNCQSDLSNEELILVSENPVIDPPVNSTIDVPACEGDDVELSVTGITGATYEWFGPDGFNELGASPVISNITTNQEGEYFVVVTRAGCGSTSVMTSVSVNETPDRPILSGPENVCEGSNAILTIENPVANPSGTVRYIWFNADNGDIVGNTSIPTLMLPNAGTIDAGNYIALIDMDGCASELSLPININVVPGLTVNAPVSNSPRSNPICEGDDIMLLVDDIADADYQWIGPNGFTSQVPNPIINNATIADAGQYFVTITQNGCSLTTPFTEVFLLERAPQPQLEDPGSICAGGDITLTISNPPIQPGLSVIYEWYDALTNQLVITTTVPQLELFDVTDADERSYFVIVIMNGCASDPSVVQSVVVGNGPTLTGPSNTTTQDMPACPGDDVMLNVDLIPGATYQWFGPNGFTSDVFNPMITNLSTSNAGEYFVIVNANGCETRTPITELFVNPTPESPVIAALDALCVGSDAQLNITFPDVPTGSDVSYTWFDAATNQEVGTTVVPTINLTNVNLDDAGDYFAIINVDGCPSGQSNLVNLDVDQIPNEQAFGGAQLAYACTDEEVQLEAVTPSSPNTTGAWTAIGSAQVVQPTQPATLVWDLEPGENQFIWTLSSGACFNFDSDTVTVLNEGLIIAEDDIFSLNEGEVIESNMVVLNDDFDSVEEWVVNIVEQPTTGTVTVNSDGSFTYVPKEGFFSGDIFTYEICNRNCPELCDEATVTVRSTTVGECFVPNFITPNADGANDNFTIPCLDNPDAFPNNEMIIYNRWGDEVFTAAPYQNNWDGSWRNAPLPPGTYFYCMRLTPDSEAEIGFVTIVR